MTTVPKAYEEIIDFIASGPSREQVAAFRASQELSDRVEDLVFREKTAGLSNDERAELETCLALNHIMALARAKALGTYQADLRANQ